MERYKTFPLRSKEDGVTTSQKLKQSRGGLVFRAHRLFHHSTLGSRVIKKTWRRWCTSPPQSIGTSFSSALSFTPCLSLVSLTLSLAPSFSLCRCLSHSPSLSHTLCLSLPPAISRCSCCCLSLSRSLCRCRSPPLLPFGYLGCLSLYLSAPEHRRFF